MGRPLLSPTRVVAGLALATLAACAASATNGAAFSGGASYTSVGDAGVGGSDATDFIVMQEAGVAPLVQGSPLCNAMAQSPCYPDDPAQQCDPLVDAGILDASDAGAAPRVTDAAVADAASDADPSADAAVASADASGDAGAMLLGCHVAPAVPPDGGVGPVCNVAGMGTDGDPCARSSDCAPTFECVGAGVCRRYCCAGSCGAGEFCDIQSEVRPNPVSSTAAPIPVPVCMPVRFCTLPGELMDAGACSGPDETCAVVLVETDGGSAPSASCVATGPATAGTSCERVHCAAGLTCIGSWGDRVCYSLCDTTDAGSCAASEICAGGLPLFPDPMTGVCRGQVAAIGR